MRVTSRRAFKARLIFCFEPLLRKIYGSLTPRYKVQVLTYWNGIYTYIHINIYMYYILYMINSKKIKFLYKKIEKVNQRLIKWSFGNGSWSQSQKNPSTYLKVFLFHVFWNWRDDTILRKTWKIQVQIIFWITSEFWMKNQYFSNWKIAFLRNWSYICEYGERKAPCRPLPVFSSSRENHEFITSFRL